MSELVNPPGSTDAGGGNDSGSPGGALLPRVERPLCPLPEVVVLLDSEGRTLNSSHRYAGPRLERFEFLPGSTPHAVMHNGCNGRDCHFVDDWEKAWATHGSGLPIEWLLESEATGSCLKLRLQTVDYICSELYGEALCDFDDCTLLYIQDMSALGHRSRVTRAGSQGNVAVFPLRRATDPHPDLVKSLDARLQSVTSRLLLAQEAERKRIAAELHDCLGQSLSLLRYEIEALLDTRTGGPGDDRSEPVARIYEHSRRALEELRTIVRGLQPTVLDDRGVPGALEVLCRDFASMAGRTEFVYEIAGDARRVDDRVAIAVYRIAQEALNNVLRHADANHARLGFAIDDDAVSLVVADDGRGLPVGRPLRKGLGLITMRERAESLGGSFEIETRVGEGCTIRARWPLEQG